MPIKQIHSCAKIEVHMVNLKVIEKKITMPLTMMSTITPAAGKHNYNSSSEQALS